MFAKNIFLSGSLLFKSSNIRRYIFYNNFCGVGDWVELMESLCSSYLLGERISGFKFFPVQLFHCVIPHPHAVDSCYILSTKVEHFQRLYDLIGGCALQRCLGCQPLQRPPQAISTVPLIIFFGVHF